jgi:transcriptional repressor NrdR
MKCSFGDSNSDQVFDSRLIEHAPTVRRRRECSSCKRKYATFEKPEEPEITVIKSESRREPFDRKKI